VMFFGDSYVQGYGLTDSDTLPWIVQKKHPELNVSNYGAGNFGTYQSWLAMRKWVHQPATVYHLVNGFHEERNAAAPSWLRIFVHPPEGCFYPYAELSGDALVERRSSGNVVWPIARRIRLAAMINEYRDMLEARARMKDKRRVTEKVLLEMNELVERNGGKFVAILFDMTPEERPSYRAFVESHHIAFLDCDRPEMKDRSLRQPDGHPLGRLNELLGEWIEPLPVVSERTLSASR